jgi:hypothetical protein
LCSHHHINDNRFPIALLDNSFMALDYIYGPGRHEQERRGTKPTERMEKATGERRVGAEEARNEADGAHMYI